MTISEHHDVYYDPFDVGINADPYPTFKRLRDESPIYYNERYDVWALSRHSDVEKGLVDWQTFSNARGDILEVIKSGLRPPSGVILWEDPPIHTKHRGLMSRVFTPRRMNALEDQARSYCASCLDPLVGSDRFDFVKDLGEEMPMRVIGMLLGIPESDQDVIREHSDRVIRTDPGKPLKVDETRIVSGSLFADYIEWRAQHPSDDLMTALLNAEFEDETGEVRKLTRQEVLTYTELVAGAGNETTGRLIGWLGKVLGDHPDQRRELVENRALVPNVIEETLRFEPTGPHVARYVARDVEYYGTTVPAGSAILMLVGAADRDERRYPDPDRFDIHREDVQHLTFGYGIHFCLGAALARLEGRVALDEILDRFPEWEVDYDDIELAPTSTVRGWERLPTFVGGTKGHARR
jgi:cytochrome P450